jgi:hypothetical protein
LQLRPASPATAATLLLLPPLFAVTAHLTGLHSAIKMLAAKLAIIQQQVEDVAEGNPFYIE